MRHCRRLRGRRMRAVVLAREVVEAEFARRRSPPTGKPGRVPPRGSAPSAISVAGDGRGEAQQHGAGLDLQPLARHRLDLQRRVVIGENGAGLQLAVVLEQDIHGEQARRRSARAKRVRLADARIIRARCNAIARTASMLHSRRLDSITGVTRWNTGDWATADWKCRRSASAR